MKSKILLGLAPVLSGTAHIRFFRWSSWASLIAPLMAYVLCSEASTGHLFSHGPRFGRNVGLLRNCLFLASSIIAALVLSGNIGFKMWRFFWLPLAGLILTYLLYMETACFTRFLD